MRKLMLVASAMIAMAAPTVSQAQDTEGPAHEQRRERGGGAAHVGQHRQLIAQEADGREQHEPAHDDRRERPPGRGVRRAAGAEDAALHRGDQPRIHPVAGEAREGGEGGDPPGAGAVRHQRRHGGKGTGRKHRRAEQGEEQIEETDDGSEPTGMILWRRGWGSGERLLQRARGVLTPVATRRWDGSPPTPYRVVRAAGSPLRVSKQLKKIGLSAIHPFPAHHPHGAPRGI